MDLMLTDKGTDFRYVWKKMGFTCDGEHPIGHTGGMEGTRTGVFLSEKHKIGLVFLAGGEFDFPYTYFETIQTLLAYGRSLR